LAYYTIARLIMAARTYDNEKALPSNEVTDAGWHDGASSVDTITALVAEGEYRLLEVI